MYRFLAALISLHPSQLATAWVAGVFLAGFIRFLVAQEPIPLATGQPLCKTILNTSDCAHAIEARQIPLSHGRARRDRLGLHLRLTNGRTKSVVDDTASAQPTGFFYLGVCSALGYYVLSAQYDEGSAVHLVNARTGWSVEIANLPTVSPDRRRFVTLSLGHERYDPERVQVWLVQGDTLRKEWSLVPEYDDPHDVRWLSNRSFEFAHSRFEPTIAIVVDTAAIDSTGQWATRLGP